MNSPTPQSQRRTTPLLFSSNSPPDRRPPENRARARRPRRPPARRPPPTPPPPRPRQRAPARLPRTPRPRSSQPGQTDASVNSSRASRLHALPAQSEAVGYARVRADDANAPAEDDAGGPRPPRRPPGASRARDNYARPRLSLWVTRAGFARSSTSRLPRHDLFTTAGEQLILLPPSRRARTARVASPSPGSLDAASRRRRPRLR